MNDETKDELMKRTREWLQSCVNAATRSGVPEEADLEAFILAHLDGEPARLAAAREEQREACALRVDAVKCYGYGVEADEPGVRDQCAGEVRDTPLDATPLADELRTLRARVAELEAQVEAQRASSQRHMNGRESYWLEQRVKWIAEHDRYAESCKWHADRAEKAEAQVAAARAVAAEELDHGARTVEAGEVAAAVLRAMDEAKP